jgi:hypothetical protein
VKEKRKLMGCFPEWSLVIPRCHEECTLFVDSKAKLSSTVSDAVCVT